MTISDSLTRMIHSTEDFIQGVPKPSRSIILFLGGNFCDELNQNITLRPHPHVLRDVDLRLFPKMVVLRDKCLEPLIKTRLVESFPSTIDNNAATIRLSSPQTNTEGTVRQRWAITAIIFF